MSPGVGFISRAVKLYRLLISTAVLLVFENSPSLNFQLFASADSEDIDSRTRGGPGYQRISRAGYALIFSIALPPSRYSLARMASPSYLELTIWRKALIVMGEGGWRGSGMLTLANKATIICARMRYNVFWRTVDIEHGL